jgi:hypothetical protein
MQKIQAHFLQDIYRLKEGVILEVNKFKSGKWFSESSIKHSSQKIKKKKLQGISKTYEFQEDVELYDGTILPKGTYLFGSSIVAPISRTQEYRIELKLSGGSLMGDMELHRKLYREIESIMSSYEGK